MDDLLSKVNSGELRPHCSNTESPKLEATYTESDNVSEAGSLNFAVMRGLYDAGVHGIYYWLSVLWKPS